MKIMTIATLLALAGCGSAHTAYKPVGTVADAAQDSAGRRMAETERWHASEVEKIRRQIPSWTAACASTIPAAQFRGATARHAAAIEGCAQRDLDTAVARLGAERERRLAAIERGLDRDLSAGRAADQPIPPRRPLGSAFNPAEIRIVP